MISSRLVNLSRVGGSSVFRENLRVATRIFTTPYTHKINCSSRRSNSGGEKSGDPLHLWLPSLQCNNKTTPLLLPVKTPPSSATIYTQDDVIREVNQRYSNDSVTSSIGRDQFVGGMGETDPGVWFVISSPTTPTDYRYYDTLQYWELIKESTIFFKQQRPGVPFGLYTNGLLAKKEDDDNGEAVLDSIISEMGSHIKCVQVSLYAGSPHDYLTATNNDDPNAFSEVCSFIVRLVEGNVPVEVGILKKYDKNGVAKDLALSLGAREVHVY